MFTFLALNRNGDTVPCKVVFTFTHKFGSYEHLFAVHEPVFESGTFDVISHFATGFKITTLGPINYDIETAIQDCKAALDRVARDQGASKIDRLISAARVLNPQPQQEHDDMSLEQAIQANTAAIEKLIATMSAMPATGTAPAAKPTDAEKPKAKAAPKEEKPADPPAPPSGPTDKEVISVVTKLSLKDRKQAVALFQRHGAEKMSGLKPEQYADVIKDAEAVLAGKLDLLASIPEEEESLFQ